MILQSLYDLYNALLKKKVLDEPGWQPENVSFALVIDHEGKLLRIDDLRFKVQRGKKEILAPLSVNVPAREKRSSGIASNFLCDNASYCLGLVGKEKDGQTSEKKQKQAKERTVKCFEACRDRHLALLNQSNGVTAKAVRGFFREWDPLQAENHPAIIPWIKELKDGANLVFVVDGRYAQEDKECRNAWDSSFSDSDGGTIMQCLVTGEKTNIAVLHPAIKGINGAQPTGASLVSFNAKAFESYGRSNAQGLNAPVSEKAAFAYTAALQWLVRDMHHHTRLGDMTVVYWAENADESGDDILAALMGGDNTEITDSDLHDAMSKLARGQIIDWGGVPVAPTNRFYILGLSPNAARLSVRFFCQDTFGKLAANCSRFDEEMRIVSPSFEKGELPLWRLLKETANPNSRDKNPPAQLAGDMLRARLTGQRYPETLMNLVQMRIRAECGNVTFGKASLIKAFLIRNRKDMAEQAKEGITLELNEGTAYTPYLLGRLFALLEGLQEDANPGINTTIRDRYFNSACATPAVVFPRLINLAQAHLKKLKNSKPGAMVFYNRQITDILGKMESGYPTRLPLDDQGVFQLGYYHQVQKRYAKKEKED